MAMILRLFFELEGKMEARFNIRRLFVSERRWFRNRKHFFRTSKEEEKNSMTSFFVPKLDSLTSAEIRDIIEEYNNQIFHLERSQIELAEALKEDPEEAEFKLAYEENQEVIQNRKDLVEVMIKYLEETDPTFDKSMIASLKIQNGTDKSTNVQTTHETLGISANDGDENEDVDDRGMYL
jgi:hypothetical protein